MSVREVLVHVPGDREAAIEALKKNHIDYKEIRGNIYLKNTFIRLNRYGEFGSRLALHTDFAKSYEGKPTHKNQPPYEYGTIYMPYKDQLKIFTLLKKAIMKHRAEYYKKYEESMEKEKEAREKKLREIHKLVDFEKDLIVKEHKLEDQISKIRKYIADLQKNFPESTYICPYTKSKQIDGGMIIRYLGWLDEISDYLKKEEIEAVQILKSGNVDIKGVRAQKKHLKKLSSMLNALAKHLRYTVRVGIKDLQITTKMRTCLHSFFTDTYRLFEFYAKLFKKASK